ncbi:MAG: SMC-Scp complex subunit ScpB, partial [Nitrospinaceae bacterium]|nr:SMC-Scp complex subunit ScpB [Nitrospinaceae bacterium]
MAISDMRKSIEALIFVSESPLKAERIAEITEAKKGDVKKCLEALQAEYLESDRG